jgi:CheY-like chemotaxis protein
LNAFSEGAGCGSEFVLTLPLLEGAASAEDRAVQHLPEPSSDCRILIVDDNRDAAESIATFFRLQGKTVCTVFDGQRAVDEASEFEPDVVLLDIGLPLLDGYEVARRLRQLPATRSSLLLALTGYGQTRDRARAEAAGFDRHFVKPADPAALLSAVSVWLNARAGAAQAPASIANVP